MKIHRRARARTASTLAMLAAAAAALTAAAPAGATPTGAAPASVPASYTTTAQIPADCGDSMATVDRQGKAGSISVEGRSVSRTMNRGSMGYQPLDLFWFGGQGHYQDEDNNSGVNSAIVIHPDGQLVNTSHHHAVEDGVVTENRWSEFRRWGSGWQDTEDLTMSRTHYYRLSPDGYLWRYKSMDASGKTKVFGGARSLRTVEFDRTIDWKGGKADVLLTNLTNGTLREYIIPHANPTQWSLRDLRTTGWGGFRQFSTMPCGEKGRVIMGYLDTRQVAVYYDRNAYDFNGDDLSGRPTDMPALPVGTLAYG